MGCKRYPDLLGVKGFAGGLLSLVLNTEAQLQLQDWILAVLRISGGTGTLGGGVKSVEIEWNANGEGRFLGYS